MDTTMVILGGTSRMDAGKMFPHRKLSHLVAIITDFFFLPS